MAKYPNITLTNAGLSMIAESQGSGQLIFTAIKLGDGSLAAGEDIKVLAAVKNPLLTANISNIDTKTAGQTTLTATISNAAVTSGFFAREMGVYAKVGADGVEKLYAYTNAGNYADYMPDKTAQINENQIKITLIVGNAASVTAIIDSSIVYPTKETMTESISAAVATHDEKATTHAPAFAAHNADTASHSDIRAALKKAGGVPIGTITARLSKKPEAGELAVDTGALVGRATYPDLWAWVQTNAPLISEADWQAQAAAQTSVGAYSTGDGSTTFRLPRILDYVRGGLTADVGKWQGDAIRNITGTLPGIRNTYGTVLSNGALSYSNVSTAYIGSGGTTGLATLNLDASAQVPTADENRPKTIKVLYCVKAFDAETNQGLIDITALANSINNKIGKDDVGYGTKLWVSGEYVPVANTPVIVNHGLTINPINIRADIVLKCKAADGDYSVGDIVTGIQGDTVTTEDTILSPVVTATTVQVCTGAATTAMGIMIPKKTTGTYMIPTVGKWVFIFRIWY